MAAPIKEVNNDIVLVPRLDSSDQHSSRHTDTQNDYCNRPVHAQRVNKYNTLNRYIHAYIYAIKKILIHK